ncbi:MAG: TerB family tellurite resistance protein [Gemmatimonadetes bacterium]|nr:TerB family tellurite resistance protein [Gemmatimonadota bacterium]
MDFIRNLLGLENESTKPEKPNLEVATAALFLEMATVDDEFDETERARIVKHLTHLHGVSEKKARSIIDVAQKERDGAVDIWSFTSVINTHYDETEKVHMMEMVWEVVFADGQLDAHEDYLVRKIAKLLRLNHRQMIEAKMRVKKKLE